MIGFQVGDLALIGHGILEDADQADGYRRQRMILRLVQLSGKFFPAKLLQITLGSLVNRIVVIKQQLGRGAKDAYLLACVRGRSAKVSGQGRHAEARGPTRADPKLLTTGKPRHVAVHHSTNPPGKPTYRRMRLLNKFRGSEIRQCSVQRFVDSGEGVEQNIGLYHRRPPECMRLYITEYATGSIMISDRNDRTVSGN